MKRVWSILALVLLVSACVSPAFAAEPKEWTWMVFLNADNNLDSFGVSDCNEMAKVGSNDFLNIVVEMDRENGPSQYLFIEKGQQNVVKELGEVDMGDYNHMVEFVKFCKENYPAKRYALVIWNHGSGWKGSKGEILKGISYDDSSNNHITTEQLGIACKEIKGLLGQNLDILSMDACLMQMIEVAYAVKGSCDYVVASEETEPGDGYAYDGILAALKKNMTAAQFVGPFVAAYKASYNGGSQGFKASTQSAVACAELDNLRDAVDGFCKAAIAGSFGAEFKTQLGLAQKFYYRTNIDLQHFAELVKGAVADPAMKQAADKLVKACEKAIAANGSTGSTMKNAKGLAIYFPTSSYSFDKAYFDLAFAKDSMWDEMCADFYKKTTAPAIVGDLQNGDASSLAEFVATANDNNREVAAHVISKVNFAVFAEGALDAAIQAQVKTLIQQLKSK